MSFTAIIIDDEPLAIEGLRRMCERTDKVEIIGEAANGQMGIELVNALRPDAVFLDIGMPGMTGLDVAAHLAAGAAPLIVFVTAFDHFATQAFDLAVIDYVLKPLSRLRLERAIDRIGLAASHRGTAETRATDEFWAPSRGGMVRVSASSIRRISAERDYVLLETADRSYLLRASMTAMENRLDRSTFIRVHRSTIIRGDTVRELRHGGAGVWDAVDDLGNITRIGRKFLPRVREYLAYPISD